MRARHSATPTSCPTTSAYCETCAAIGLCLWAHRLNLMHADAQYRRRAGAGALQRRPLRRGPGRRAFFYVNPLGQQRQAPSPAVLRLRLLPDERRAASPLAARLRLCHGTDGVYVNLYVAGTGRAPLAGNAVTHQAGTPATPGTARSRWPSSPRRPAAGHPSADSRLVQGGEALRRRPGGRAAGRWTRATRGLRRTWKPAT